MRKGIIFCLLILMASQVLAGTSVIDLGVVSSRQVATFSIELPDDFRMIEVANYQAGSPDQVAKYMGWNGYLKADDQLVWNVKSSSANGVFIFDRTMGSVVDATSGVGTWLDATRFFRAGTNSIEFYHENQGKIGVKVRITTVTTEEAKKESSARWGFGFDVKKSSGGRCDTNSECQSDHCERHVCCEAGKECCSVDGECASYKCNEHGYYCDEPEAQPVPVVKGKTCDGCWQGNSCLPFHERLEIDSIAKYCSVSGDWLSQKEDGASCQNPYECTSNQCSAGKCGASNGVPNLNPISSEESGWTKLVNWLKSIFG